MTPVEDLGTYQVDESTVLFLVIEDWDGWMPTLNAMRVLSTGELTDHRYIILLAAPYVDDIKQQGLLPKFKEALGEVATAIVERHQKH